VVENNKKSKFEHQKMIIKKKKIVTRETWKGIKDIHPCNLGPYIEPSPLRGIMNHF